MIETVKGLENVEAIAAVDGVDGLFVGPVDLGITMGIPLAETYRHPRVLDATQRCVEVANRVGKVVGTVSNGADHTQMLFDLGVRFVSLGADKAFVSAGVRDAMAAVEGLGS